MGRPRANENRVSTPERILVAAERAFADEGYDARLGDIAAAAGIRRPSLLYHFKAKEELYAAVVARAFIELGQAMRVVRQADADFESLLEATCHAFANFVEGRPTVARLVVREIVGKEGPGTEILIGQVAPLLDEIERWIAVAGRDAIRPGVPVRAVLMHVASDVLLRSSAGEVREPLWGPTDAVTTWQLAKNMMLKDTTGDL